MGRSNPRRDRPDDGALMAFFRAIASDEDDVAISGLLDSVADLATSPIQVGASRQDPDTYFLDAIRHYVYRGDTALHIAAAAQRRELVELLVTRGADVRARNRRGAEPLHYAADASPDAPPWVGVAQSDLIAILVRSGADPNALDNSGVAALHRAVRNRCASSVRSLVDSGADPLLANKSGSTPLHLAVQNTGKSNSGSDAARAEQRRIIVFLLGHGASPTDVDAKGTTVTASATSAWIRELLGSS